MAFFGRHSPFHISTTAFARAPSGVRKYSAGFMWSCVDHSVAIHLLPWPALRLSTCFFSFLKGVLLLHFLLDWVLLSSLGILGEVGPLAPIWAFS